MTICPYLLKQGPWALKASVILFVGSFFSMHSTLLFLESEGSGEGPSALTFLRRVGGMAMVILFSFSVGWSGDDSSPILAQ